MEKTLGKGEDKIQQICDTLRRETLEPAKSEAEQIIEDAKVRAEQIIAEAHDQAEKILHISRETIEQERNVFHSSLDQAGKQSLEQLRQSIENKLFHEELQRVLEEHTVDPKVISKLITSIVNALEKEGISTELSALIPQSVSVEAVNQLLGVGILEKLKNKSVILDEFLGGAKIKLHDKKMTLDISEEALQELISQYVRKDFRKLLFR